MELLLQTEVYTLPESVEVQIGVVELLQSLEEPLLQTEEAMAPESEAEPVEPVQMSPSQAEPSQQPEVQLVVIPVWVSEPVLTQEVVVQTKVS